MLIRAIKPGISESTLETTWLLESEGVENSNEIESLVKHIHDQETIVS